MGGNASVSDDSEELEDIVLIDEEQYTARQESRRKGRGLLSLFSKQPAGFEPIQDHDDEGDTPAARPGGTAVQYTCCIWSNCPELLPWLCAAAAMPSTAGSIAGRRWCPEEECNFLSRIFFMYVNSIMRLGASKHLDEDDLWDVARRNECATLSTIYHTQMLRTSTPEKHPYVRLCVFDNL